MCRNHAGVVYGARGEVFEGGQGQTLKEFISSTFGIDNVFEKKLVMGRCICHGKKSLETDVLLGSEEDANKFVTSEESRKPHVLLIYDKLTDPANASDVAEEVSKDGDDSKDVVIPAGQWKELIESIQKLEISIQKREDEDEKQHFSNVAHPNVICDGCYPTEQIDAKEIHGARFKCLTCHNFDLCSACEQKGFETVVHKKNHNTIKINSPFNTCTGRYEKRWGVPPQSKVASDREVIIDIPEEQKQLFDMFPNLDELKRVVHGYEMYKMWTEKYGYEEKRISEILKHAEEDEKEKLISLSKPRCNSTGRSHTKQPVDKKFQSGFVEVEMKKKDKALIFKMHNKGRAVIPGGLSLVYSTFKDTDVISESNVSCELPMGPHELLPGYDKVLKFNYFGVLSDISMSTKSQIALVDSNHKVVYKGTNVAGSGSDFILEHSDASSQDLLYDQESLVLGTNDDAFQFLEKEESDGVISSAVTNDNETLHSTSSQEISNWEEYDFLSESDV